MIREATAGDIERIAEIHVAAWHAFYGDLISPDRLALATVRCRVKDWQALINVKQLDIFVLEQDGVIIGFCSTCAARKSQDPPENYGELVHLYLEPSRLGEGLGLRMIEFARGRFREAGHAGMLLWTLEHNDRARAFYERYGMRPDGARHDDPAWLGPGVFEVRYLLPFLGDQNESLQ